MYSYLSVLYGFHYRNNMTLSLVPIGLVEISAPNKPHQSSVMKQIMLPHTSSTAMAIIHKLDLQLCFTRLSVLLRDFLITSSEVGCVTQKPYYLQFPRPTQNQYFHVICGSYAVKCWFLQLDLITVYFSHLHSSHLCV